MTQRSILFLTALVFALGLPLAGSAEDGEAPTAADLRKAEKFRPTGTVTIDTTNITLGVGVSWGEGVLSFQDDSYPFKTGGFSLVGIGGSSMKAKGTVYNLENVEDFKGTWALASGSAVLGLASKGGLTLRNGDVYMTLSAEQKGAEIAAGGGTITIEFKDVAAEPKPE